MEDPHEKENLSAMHTSATIPSARILPATEEENICWVTEWMELQDADRKMKNRNGFSFSRCELQILFN